MGGGRKDPLFGYSNSQIILRLQLRGLSKTSTLRHFSSYVLIERSDIHWFWGNSYVRQFFQIRATTIGHRSGAHKSTDEVLQARGSTWTDGLSPDAILQGANFKSAEIQDCERFFPQKVDSVVVKRQLRRGTLNFGVYLVQCRECDLKYIGQTDKSSQTTFGQHTCCAVRLSH